MGINKSQIKVASYTLFAIAGVLIADMLRSLLVYEERTSYINTVYTERVYDPLFGYGNDLVEIIVIIVIVGVGIFIKKYQEQ